MTELAALYEVSWEVGHKVGGIHTVVSTKARSMVERHGDGYLAVGPWLLGEGNAEKVLDAEPAFDGFAEGCRAAGVPVRVGRWRIAGRPRVVLVEFSGLYARKDVLVNNMREGSLDKVVYEAAATCMPVLASNSGFDDVLPPELRFRHDDVDDLAAKLRAVADADRNEIGHGLRAKVEERHSVEHWADQVLAVARR